MNQYRPLAAACALAALAFAAPVFAQEEEQHSMLTIGVGGAILPSYDGSDDYRVIPIAQARGKVHDFAFWTRGASLYVDAIPNIDDTKLDFQFGPVVNVRTDRASRKGIKDNAVRALGKLDTAIEVGGFVGIGKTGVITSAYDNLSARVAWTKDVGGAHESYVISPAIEYFTPLSVSTFVGVGVSADYVGKKFGGYYYNVTPDQSLASGLPVYGRANDKSGFKKVSANFTAGKSLSGDLRHGWAIFALGGYSRVLGRYADSPVVDIAGSRDQWIGALGIGYTF